MQIAIEARALKDDSQWILGDTANRVCLIHRGGVHEPNEHTLKAFAFDINLNFKTIQEYSRIARIYPKSNRIGLLSFRHHQIASKLDNKEHWLKEAADNQWTTEVLYAKIKEQNKDKSKEGKEEIIVNIMYDNLIKLNEVFMRLNPEYQKKEKVIQKKIKQIFKIC